VVCGILSLPQSVMRRVNTSIRPIVRRASETTVYRWNAKFGGLTLSDAKRVRQLEAENSGLKRLLAEARLDDAALQGPARKMYGPPRLARLKMMCELALQQCIRPLASGLVFQPGRDEIRTARS
jgi:hypothetical protein